MNEATESGDALPGPDDPTPRGSDVELRLAGGETVCVRDDVYSDRVRCDHATVRAVLYLLCRRDRAIYPVTQSVAKMKGGRTQDGDAASPPSGRDKVTCIQCAVIVNLNNARAVSGGAM